MKYRPTMKLRIKHYSPTLITNWNTGKHDCRKLQQLWIDSNGDEVWIDVDFVEVDEETFIQTKNIN